MGYQVWRNHYGDDWKLEECETETEVQNAILEAKRQGFAVKLTRELDFDLAVNIREKKEEKFPQPPVKPKPAITEVKEVDKSGPSKSGPEVDSSPGD